MNSDIIMECMCIIKSEFPVLRDRLKITQQEFAISIGIPKISVIEIEQKIQKLRRAY